MEQGNDAVQDTAKHAVDTARHAVGRYYDRNTKGFLSAGEGGKSLAIHRGIWAPGTLTVAGAAEHVPALMLGQARETGARHILDLGCGVGGTCLYLAAGLGRDAGSGPGYGNPQASGPRSGTHRARIRNTGELHAGQRHAPGLCPEDLHAGNLGEGDLRITGMTISGAQVQLGGSLVGQRGLEGVVSLIQGDYTNPDSFAGLPAQDLVLALESFIHSPDLGATLANATAALRPGGRLVICDDMIVADPGIEDRGLVDRDLADFRRCWHAYGLSSRDSLAGLCQGLGLELLVEEDLSPLLRLFRPRDRLAAFFLPALRPFRNWPWAQNLVGGTALQRLLARGCLAYRYQVWVKPC